jgi:hypothetical protein
MLAGKVIGNGAAGLTQYGIVLAAVAGGLLAQAPIHKAVVGSNAGTQFGGLAPNVLAAFVILFVLGFLLYSLLYAALGSLVSRQEDVQSATSPLMVLIMAGYFMSVFSLQAIDETWVCCWRSASSWRSSWPPGSTAPASCSTASDSACARFSRRPASRGRAMPAATVAGNA